MPEYDYVRSVNSNNPTEAIPVSNQDAGDLSAQLAAFADGYTDSIQKFNSPLWATQYGTAGTPPPRTIVSPIYPDAKSYFETLAADVAQPPVRNTSSVASMHTTPIAGAGQPFSFPQPNQFPLGVSSQLEGGFPWYYSEGRNYGFSGIPGPWGGFYLNGTPGAVVIPISDFSQQANTFLDYEREKQARRANKKAVPSWIAKLKL